MISPKTKNIIFFLVVFFITCSSVLTDPVKSYKVVIDPGHGGVRQSPYQIYGDKYDPIRGKYLEHFKVGASYKSRTEMEIVLKLALEVNKALRLTRTRKGFKKFKKFIRLFSNTDAPWIRIDSILTRRDSYKDRNYREKDDKNARYRLYDYPDFKTGKMKLGRISRINRLKPPLVVSLHINTKGNRGMGAVITPSYKTFKLLKDISMGKKSKKKFKKSDWRNWLVFYDPWNHLQNAVADAWIYFHGYWPDKSGRKTNLKRFEGYRYNMVTWRYKDDGDWIKEAIADKPGPYAKSHKEFKAIGKFWDRERSKYEFMRRENGPEGYGGDNYYAGKELIRFIQYGLRVLKKSKDRYKTPSPILRPYISTYSMPTFINAISAFLELGDISHNKDMYFMTKKRKRVAVCIAVGIYSLFHGLEIRPRDYPYIPKGNKIDFNKYKNRKGISHFDRVVK